MLVGISESWPLLSGKQTERELRNNDHFHVPWARTEMVLSSCNIKRARLCNKTFAVVNPYVYTNALKQREDIS